MSELIQLILKYVKGCLNDDGGYSFCQGVDSNAQDTFFALSIQQLLDASPQKKGKTLKWLRNFPLRDIRICYYVTRSVSLLYGGADALGAVPLRKFTPKYDDTELVSSEIESIYMVTFMTHYLGLESRDQTISDFIMSIWNKDGGFGIKGHSNLITTNYAIMTMEIIGHNIEKFIKVLDFVRSCEVPEGGFTSVPGAHLPFIEETYAGISLLDKFGERPLFREQCRQQILRCLTSNGGFSRAEFGIPTLENTYHAAFSLNKLGFLR
uniref:Geranylgeranyl transferase type II subunit beta n=1 Tax=Candidatus Methanomethylicus mesodigestus TaxID=1867258 RepID=A0A7C3J414_9CREN